MRSSPGSRSPVGGQLAVVRAGHGEEDGLQVVAVDPQLAQRHPCPGRRAVDDGSLGGARGDMDRVTHAGRHPAGGTDRALQELEVLGALGRDLHTGLGAVHELLDGS